MKLFKSIKYEYNSIINSIKFFLAKRKANKYHKLTGRRYHVIPYDDNKLVVVDNYFIKHYNKKAGSNKITIKNLIEMSYYSTPVQGITRRN